MGAPEYPKFVRHLWLKKSAVGAFTDGTIANDGRQIEAISSVTDLHSRGGFDTDAKFVEASRALRV